MPSRRISASRTRTSAARSRRASGLSRSWTTRAAAAGRFLGCSPDEVTFGANMTSLSFALSRTAARVRSRRRDRRHAPRPRRQRRAVAGAGRRPRPRHPLRRHHRRLRRRPRRPRAAALVAHPRRRLPGRVERRRHADGRPQDRRAGAQRGRARVGRRRPRRAARADRRRRLGRGRPPLLAVQVLRAPPRRRVRPARGRRSWRPYKVRPQADEPLGHRFETGTQPFELLAGFVAAVEYVESIGWAAIQAHERSLGERFLAGLPAG